ncbi:MAG: bifunctional pyr operon transcriptional regulator/uracil phosphoribosyltransferase PyrR [Kiritimatiellae bacterium]|nr:bifunctional pyr operon transcriptional regulator/uracil phosphoribosyltransferase PyrR [Kiritimatiellia bacterium]
MSEPSLSKTHILDEKDINHKLRRIASEILEQHPKTPLAFVGIHTRGVIVADRIYNVLIEDRKEMVKGSLDISLYRDDLDNLGSIPSIKNSDLPFEIEGATVILFDDVLFTGRTIRAAINVLTDYGRPAKIELAVLIDRGNRELPIAPNYTGHTIQTSKKEHICSHFHEIDDEEGVYKLINSERAS